MSEMLANHYFLVRNFPSAKSLFEKILKNDNSNNKIKKKLIICCVITGDFNQALDLFISQIKNDINVILNTDINSEDCPCTDLIAQIENQDKFFSSEPDRLAGVGILWLYCNLEESVKYFSKLKVISPNDERYSTILSILTNKMITTNKGTIN